MIDPVAREHEAIQILDEWKWNEEACLIGGYAISAYGRPRHSRDLDFVIPATGEDSVLGHLKDVGFLVRPLRKPERSDAFRDSKTLRRGDVSIDVFLGYVRDKNTRISVPEHWIAQRSREMRLVLLTGSTRKAVRVCRPEALWVLKLIAGRDQDLADLFAISAEPINTPEIREFFAEVSNRALVDRFIDEESRLESEKIFSDSLSARFLSKSADADRRSWNRFKTLFSQVVK